MGDRISFDPITWDDYGYRTTFVAVYFSSSGESIGLGNIKKHTDECVRVIEEVIFDNLISEE